MPYQLIFSVHPNLASGTWVVFIGDRLLSEHVSYTDAVDEAFEAAEGGWSHSGITTEVSVVDLDGHVRLWRRYGPTLH
ncbi:hypothetical protein [Tahibacter amnicola]|uniref:Uncharacterized protein n=1 Tax=Tahibacter amnicola TaxID=2976241 RepID=A0ABY6BNA5_9GAMM|nr:hypothetical protein [Tahibacter amnicola]UXI69865.1 hypothetical protein N4264_09625 [Tahibacter amnicola]